MCGIAGYFGEDPPSDARVRTCLSLMERRGPDAEGRYRHAFMDRHQVLLLATRLSILDLDPRSDQPFTDGGCALVYNGEIYNYREVREQLRRQGTSFRTDGDTEVLFRTLERSGAAGLDGCEGMWAFAWYNEQSGSLLLSRDRFGEKPLYLWERRDGVYFGSEPKFLFALAGAQPPVNIEHLCRFMVHGFRSLYKTDTSFFRELRTLPQASVLEINPGGGQRQWRYWTPPGDESEREMGYDEAVTGVREHMMESVRLRLRADVPLAFCMSGGVDSNSLISIAKRNFDFDVRGFTFTSDDPRYNEMEVIRRSVQELGIDHTVVEAETERFIPHLRELVRYHDAPVHTITWYANWLLLEAISGQGFKVSLSGIGADEMFSGYFDHHLAYLHDMRSRTRIYEAALRGWKEHVEPVVRNPYLRDPELFVRDPEFRGHLVQNEAAFADFLREGWSEPFTEAKWSKSLLRNRMLNELFFENVPVYTHEEDLNAMYFSVENRSPYLDRNLFEFCRSVPTRHLIRNGKAKVLLRDAMRGIVPDCVLDTSRKVGFNASIFAFLDVNDPETRDTLLEEGPVFDHVRRGRIEMLLSEPELDNAQSKFLFAFLNTKIFLEEYG